MLFTWLRYGKPDVSMTFNAALAGLVGITAGCDAVNPFGAAIIGICCGLAVVLSVEFFDKVVKIDDPVGAISGNGVCGALGTVLTGFFAPGASTMKGVFYGGGFRFLGIQLLGVASTIAWTAVVITLVFTLIKKTIGLRADAADEAMGLDRSEHGLVTAYSGFSILPDGSLAEGEIVPMPTPIETAETPRKAKEKAPDAPVYTRVQIICRPASLESLKTAMNKIGITGMTVTNVMGYGMQKGKPEYYRGTPVEVTLLPKVQVDIVVSKVPVRQVIDTARSVLHTGHIGDGKIFVQDVENVVRVRTGEEGYDALQSDE
jgi:Amt family ammonium transporter